MEDSTQVSEITAGPLSGNNSVTVTGPTTGTTYQFRIRAQPDSGHLPSDWTSWVTVTPTATAGFIAGALDPSFGTGGKVTTAIGSAGDRGHAVAIQSGGKIVVAGKVHIGGETLNVSGMNKLRWQAQAIRDAAIGGLLRKVEYKCRWYGTELGTGSCPLSLFRPPCVSCRCAPHL